MKTLPLDMLTGRYSFLLIATLLLFVFEPLVATQPETPLGLTSLTFLVFVGSLRAIWSDRTLLLLIGLCGSTFVALEAAAPISENGLPILTDVAGVIFLTLVSWGILTDIFSRNEVEADTVFGASAVYLLIGFLFARLFMLIAHIDPEAFAVSDAIGVELAEASHRGSSILRYFSLITLTTVGYGDIAPVAPIARNLAAVEAVIGQLYIAAVIARLVAIYTTKTARPPQ
ncbi:MAG: ion channel [Candidatus Binatia bacterium]|nr:ion channel [Candidatus Binatia bacterium]